MAELEAVGEEVGQHPGTVLLSHTPRAAAGGGPEQTVGSRTRNGEDVETVVEGLDEDLEPVTEATFRLAARRGEKCG